MKALVVVDMQNDFIDGVLGTKEAVSIVPNVAKEIKDFDGDEIFVTFDTHYENYLDTFEGKHLSVPHCIFGTRGHNINASIAEALEGKKFRVILKNNFGTMAIYDYLKDKGPSDQMQIELIGLCTDICVISNAMILRTCFPEAEITVNSACCAGVTPEKHDAALEVLRSCQINVI